MTADSAAGDSTGWIGLPLSSRPCVTPLRDMVKAEKKKRSETNTNTDEVWTRRGREFKQAGSLTGVVSDKGGGSLRVVGWVRVCGGWRRHLDEERQLQEFSRRKENNQAGEHRTAHIRH